MPYKIHKGQTHTSTELEDAFVSMMHSGFLCSLRNMMVKILKNEGNLENLRVNINRKLQRNPGKIQLNMPVAPFGTKNNFFSWIKMPCWELSSQVSISSE